MLLNVGKYIGMILLVVVLGIGVLNGTKGAPSTETMQKNVLSKAYLEKNSDNYASCKNSLTFAPGFAFSTNLQLSQQLPPELYDEGLVRLKEIENNFNEELKQKCEPVVVEYETQYEIYETSWEELQKASQSVFDKMIGSEPKRTLPIEDLQYSPGLVSMRGGDNSYSREQVEHYFRTELQ